MFNRYWRTYPWGLQVGLFLLTIFTVASFCTYLVLVMVPKLSGLSLKDITQLSAASGMPAIRAGLLAQGIAHAGTFALPGLVFAMFTHPRMRDYLGLRRAGKAIHWPLVTGIMLGIIPVFLWGESWSMQHFHFGKWAEGLQDANNKMFEAFFQLGSTGDLLLLLCILALLPAVGEEIIFRGVLLRLLHRRTGRPVFHGPPNVVLPAQDPERMMVFPVIFTGLLFAAIHFNPHGFIFILIAGCLLALIYFLTGSLLCSIWAHFLYNGLQVAGEFYRHHNAAVAKIADSPNLPAVYPLAGLLLFTFCFYHLVKNQTPLPANWSDDFLVEGGQAGSIN